MYKDAQEMNICLHFETIGKYETNEKDNWEN